MAQQDSTRRLMQLLTDAGEAHHHYETEVLKVRDDDWAGWYARHLVEHGIKEVLGRAVPADRLGAQLSEYAAAHAAEQSTDSCQEYYARRIQDAAHS